MRSLTQEQGAQVAKLVDALCSGRSAFTGVLVRIQSWAPNLKTPATAGVFCWVLLPFCNGSRIKRKRIKRKSWGNDVIVCFFVFRRDEHTRQLFIIVRELRDAWRIGIEGSYIWAAVSI